MNIGWLDVCLRVSSVANSREFYSVLGFRHVEGDDAEGWAVMANEEARIGLFEAKHMGANAFTLNFRGGEVESVVAALSSGGFDFVSEPLFTERGASATIKDPDGHVLFFDSMVGETKKV
jgi:predicted lactoylglutathione lyase